MDDKFLRIADAMLTAVDSEEIPVREDNIYLLELLAQTASLGYNLRGVEDSAREEEAQ